MKYVVLVKKGELFEAMDLGKGEFHQTVKGELIQVVAGKVKVRLEPGAWASLVEPKKTKEPKVTKGMIAFMKKWKPSPELSQVIGNESMTRAEAIRKMWKFITSNGLQDKVNRRMINVGKNSLTKAIFKRESISMFDMSKEISKHLSDGKGKRMR